MSAVSMVYFAVRSSDSLVKIGTSIDPERRVAQLATGAGPIALIGTMPGSFDSEHQVHQRFSHLRAHGEWFRMGDDLAEYVDRLDPVIRSAQGHAVSTETIVRTTSGPMLWKHLSVAALDELTERRFDLHRRFGVPFEPFRRAVRHLREMVIEAGTIGEVFA